MNTGRWGPLVLVIFCGGLAVFLFFENQAQRAEFAQIRESLLTLQEAVERIAAPDPTADRASAAIAEQDTPLDPTANRAIVALAEINAPLDPTANRVSGTVAEQEAPLDPTAEETSGAVAALQSRLREGSSRADRRQNEVHQWGTPEVYNRILSRVKRSPTRLDPDKLTKTQATVLDFTGSDRARMSALRKLRSEPRDSNPYSPEVVEGLTAWMAETEDPRTRARVIRNLHRGGASELQKPLLDYLRNDPDPDVRKEAAAALQYNLDDPTLRYALSEAAEYDPDEGVRRRASRTLEKLDRQRDRL